MWFTVYDLAKIAVEAPHALELAMILFEVPPCRTCGYVKKHCRCGQLFTEEELKETKCH